jgi:AmmeMemoRadiSam system protein B
MPVPERPKLRPHLAVAPEDRQGRAFIVSDLLRLNGAALRLNPIQLQWCGLFDGKRTLRDVQAEAMRQAGGRLLPLELFGRLAEALDEALYLDGPRYRERVDGPVRLPVCIGTYEEEPRKLRKQLGRLFAGPGGPGAPSEPKPDDRLRAVLAPHIDYGRGGVSYGWAFQELCERTPASLFVIVATSHYSANRFTLTRKDFQTPFGVVPTDQEYIDRLVAHYGDGLFDDELLAHMPEHSVELEVVLLQYLYEGRRPIRIVPLVVGSFADCIETGGEPTEWGDVARMVEALRAVEKEFSEPICYVISGDLAHIGPKFGDDQAAEGAWIDDSRARDHALLKRAETADPAGYFRAVADEGDRRRICGLSPTYTVLEAIRPRSGKLLHYDQFVHPQGHESVSFASVGFYR